MIVQKKDNQNENNNINAGDNNINNDINDNNNDFNINVEEISNNLGQLIYNSNLGYVRRGFNIFLLHGLSLGELRTMRLLFHLSLYQQNSLEGNQLDWSEEAMLQREERWLINQLNNRILNNNGGINNNGNNDNDFGDNENDMINRNNNYISLNINDNDNENFILRRRFIENLFNFEFETSYLIILGFCSGFLLNIFGLVLLLCRFKPRFKVGLIFGMITSMLFYSMAILSSK